MTLDEAKQIIESALDTVQGNRMAIRKMDEAWKRVLEHIENHATKPT